jgi:hypothetical protein
MKIDNRPEWGNDYAVLLLELKDALAERGGRPKTNPEHVELWDRAHAMYLRMLKWANPAKPSVCLPTPNAIALTFTGDEDCNAARVALEEPFNTDAVVEMFDGQYLALESRSGLARVYGGPAMTVIFTKVIDAKVKPG